MADKIIDVPGVGLRAFPEDMSDEEIKAILNRKFGPASREEPTVTGRILNSPIGGFIRGLRDLPDAGAQLLTRGVEGVATTVAPDSGFADWATRQRENVEKMIREAEIDYQQNWRKGQMGDSIDSGRIVGNIATALPAAAAAPIRAGMTLGQIATRGAAQGAIAAPLTQPVLNTKDQGYLSQKAQQAGLGAAFGAGGSVAGNALGTLIQGGRRAGGAVPTGNQTATASTNVNVNPTARATGGGSVIGQVGPDPTSTLTTTQRRLLERGRELGFRNTPGQASGSRALQQMEARLESNPLTSGPFNTIRDNNQRVLNRAVAGSIGEASDVVDDAVLGTAVTRLEGIFDSVADRVPKAVIGDDIVASLGAIEREAADILEKPLLDNKLVAKAFNIAAKGQATGAELRDLSRKLGVAAKYNMTSPNGDRMLGESLFGVKDMVDEIVAQNITDDAAREAFNAARGQYRNLMTLVSRTNIVNPASGNVSGPNLAGALMSRDRRGYTFGENTSDLYDAARFAQAFKPIVNDSGTATRSMPIGATDFLLSLPTNIATRAYVSQPVQAAASGTMRGIAPNIYGDAAAKALRAGSPGAGMALGFRGLLEE